MSAKTLTAPPATPAEGEHCTLVNPLCPDDLCVLAFGHDGRCLLGTDAWDTPNRSRAHTEEKPFYFAKRGTPIARLINLGARRQDALYPRDER